MLKIAFFLLFICGIIWIAFESYQDLPKQAKTFFWKIVGKFLVVLGISVAIATVITQLF